MHSTKPFKKLKPSLLLARKTQALTLIITAFTGMPLQSHSAPDPQIINLKQDHEQANQLAAQRLAECARLEQQFSELDLYRSASGSRTYGVDIRGRVWTLKRDPSRGCSLQTDHRLNRAEYELDYLGKRIWNTFYYEDKQLCLYTRSYNEKPSRKCYQPAGIISKLAPYFLN